MCHMKQYPALFAILLASTTLATLSNAALAADPPIKRLQKKSVTWTSCYGGLTGGYGSQTTETSYNGTNEGSNSGNSGVVGGQLGCDYQHGNVIFGVQGLIASTNLSGSNDYSDNEGGVLTVDARWFATFAGRVCYAIQPTTLLYTKAGAAWMNSDFQDTNGTDVSGSPKSGSPAIVMGEGTLTGWTVGVGIERKISQNWSFFGEYNYMNFGSNSVKLISEDENATWTNKYTQDVSVFLVGINYHL